MRGQHHWASPHDIHDTAFSRILVNIIMFGFGVEVFGLNPYTQINPKVATLPRHFRQLPIPSC